MATYRHWSVSLWRNPDDVSHCRIPSRQNWMAAYLGYTLRMKTLFRSWPVMVHDMHTRRRRRSDLIKVTIIQHQITWKWYNIQLCLQWPASRKSYVIYRKAPFSMTLNDLYPQFQGHAILWRGISHKRYNIQTYLQWNTNRGLHTPYSTVSFPMTLSDLEWLSKIFNVTKHRAVSLRQLSFLICL